jgi:hypothetical protein
MRIAVAVVLLAAVASAQTEFGVTEISDYRLDAAVFARFDRASRLIGAAIRADARFAREPLFTKEILLSDDTPHEYTKFVLALAAARLAHGFVKSGVLRRVPEGVHADNVNFVDAHLAGIAAAMKEIGVD